MNAQHPLIPRLSNRRTVAVSLPVVGGGLRLLLRGGVLPVGVESLQFVCDLDRERGMHITIIALHEAGHSHTCEMADDLRLALERCFLRFLNRRRRTDWAPLDGQVDIWEWAAARPNSLRRRRRRREVFPAPP